MGNLFGTDGVRGIANQELTPEMTFRLGRVAAYLLASKQGLHRSFMVVGRDTRLSGDMLEAALVAGICSVGVDVLRVGILPTPAIAYLTQYFQAEAGIMISASHNPIEDNGIKFFSRDGFKLSDDAEEKIEVLVLSSEDHLPRPIGDRVGQELKGRDGFSSYKEYLISTVDVAYEGLNIIIDSANGATSKIAGEVFRDLGARVEVINCDMNGKKINVNCGSTHPEMLQKEVIKRKADLGLAFDGDGDRVIAVDEKGAIVNGDTIMVVLANYFYQRNKLNNKLVVTTVMSNWGLEEALTSQGIEVVRTKVGDRYVLEEMLHRDACIGGEQSGHIILRDYNTTGDGLLTALKLTEVIKSKGLPLSTLSLQMKHLPQLLINVNVRDKKKLEEDGEIWEAIGHCQKRLEGRGRIIVRPSGTEPLVRIMAEGPDASELEEIVGSLAKLLTRKLN